MKFGKFFEEELAKLKVPQSWIDSAIQYKALKKRIHRFTKELETLGLSKETLKVLQESTTSGGISENSNLQRTNDNEQTLDFGEGIARQGGEITEASKTNSVVQYSETARSVSDTISTVSETHASEEEYGLDIEIEALEKDGVLAKPMARYFFQHDSHYMKPKLVIYLTSKDAYSEEIKLKIAAYIDSKSRSNGKISEIIDEQNVIVEDAKLLRLKVDNIKITISLNEDDKFFQMIFLELQSLQELKQGYKKEMTGKIQGVANIIGTLSAPSKFRTDMDNWREIFELYLDNRIFFITDDLHGERTVDDSMKRLDGFLKEVDSAALVKGFKHRRSKLAFTSFYELNNELLLAMKFQELNRTAVNKILKKFDKQTALMVKKQFPELISSEPFINESFIANIYAIIAERLVSVVPQLEDYNCPICFTIAYKPIRLTCGHVYCIQCLINLQRQRKENCPVCRAVTVLQADSTCLDVEMQRFMEKNFPKQTKAKQKERLKEVEKEAYARALMLYRNDGCIIM